MIHTLRYRLLGALLTAIFCVFTIGVPVVLASCPMMAAGGSSERLACCPSSLDRSAQSLSAYKNTSCCETKFAATRNTQEYVQAGADVLKDTGVAYVPAPVFLAQSIASSTAMGVLRLPEASPPLFSSDLPVLHSALLI